MTAAYLYCTPEWLEACERNYRSNPKYQKKMEKLSLTVCFQVKADPAWGIDQDIIFGLSTQRGELTRTGFFSPEEAARVADFILSATPQEWKKILRKEGKFVGDFMLGKITLEQGSKVGVLSVAPHSTTLVEALTEPGLRFPDELSPEELTQYRAQLQAFRAEQGV